MSPSPIRCCFRDCALVVWDVKDARLVVVRDSATCMQCRRVALCGVHLVAVRHSQGHLACPNCQSKRWYVVVLAPGNVGEALLAEVRREGGRVDTRYDDVASALADAGLARSHLTPTAEWPDELQVVRLRDLPPGTRPAAPGVALRSDAKGALVYVGPGGPDAPLPHRIDGMVRAVAATGDAACLVLEMAPTEAHPAELLWLDREGHRGMLRNALEGGARGPAFIDERRFVYFTELPDGASELREAWFEGTRRLRSRRIGARGRYLTAPDLGPIVVDGGTRVAVLRAEGDGQVSPVLISLADSEVDVLDGPQSPPTAMVGARDAPALSWVTVDGSVLTAALHRPVVELSAKGAPAMAVSPNGELTAWMEGGDVVVGAVEGETRRCAAPDDVAALRWSTR